MRLKPLLSVRRRETADELLRRASIAATVSRRGSLFSRTQTSSRRSVSRTAPWPRLAVDARPFFLAWLRKQWIPPAWRAFQLAFLLMNLRGIAEPSHADREVVDLLFFPTGGGKTEAYLGLAAFTLVLRRLRHPGIGSAGVSVLMRYTLRLLTLDQLSRAAALICALELERQK